VRVRQSLVLHRPEATTQLVLRELGQDAQTVLAVLLALPSWAYCWVIPYGAEEA